MLTGVDTEDFLSSLLEEEENMGPICASHSPLGSDSGISEDSSTVCRAGNSNPRECPSPQSSDSDIVPSPVCADPPLLTGEVQKESMEAFTVQADHSYSLPQSGCADMDILQSVRAENPDTDVFIDFGKCCPNPQAGIFTWISDNCPRNPKKSS